MTYQENKNLPKYNILKSLMLADIKKDWYDSAIEYLKNNPNDVNGFMVMLNGA